MRFQIDDIVRISKSAELFKVYPKDIYYRDNKLELRITNIERRRALSTEWNIQCEFSAHETTRMRECDLRLVRRGS